MSALGPIQGFAFGSLDQIARPESSSPAGPTEGAPESGIDFADAFTGALSRAESAERSADDLAGKFAAGDANVGLHEVMLESGKANVAVRFAVTLKNRAIDAYRELMKTPI